MGLYGKYTETIHVLATTQMVVGVLMLLLGIALRIFVCSWVTNAAFGFWVGLWVFIGGLIGKKSARRDVYGMIGYFVGFNSLSIMLTSVVIFCHSLALVHSHKEMQPNMTTIWNHSNHSNHSIMPSFTITLNISNSTSKVIISPTYTLSTAYYAQKSSSNVSLNQTLSTISPTLTAKSNSSSNHTKPSTRGCYTHQTWSDRENGKRGVGLGAGMIFVCSVEILVAVLSFGYCWSAASIEPINSERHKTVAQGIYSDVVSSLNVQEIVTNLTDNEEEQLAETNEGIVPNDDEEELDGQYEDTPAAPNTEERVMNIYDGCLGASGEKSEQHPEQSLACERDENQMHMYDHVVEDIKGLMQQKEKTDDDGTDAMEMRPVGSYDDAPGASTNDPCSSSYSSLPPFHPPPYPSFPTPYPDSD